MSVYDIKVTNTDGDRTIVYGGGDIKTVSYLANRAVKALADLDEGAEVAVSITRDGASVLNFTGDADMAAMGIKAKAAKLRKAEGVSEAEATAE